VVAPQLAVEFKETQIDAICADLDQCHSPGGAVGVAIGGKPVYRKGFGLASMELPVLLSPSTRLRIASTSKHFTCLAYLLLCEEGRAGIDDPVGRHLPELHPVTHRVTMRQLMGNTGGLRDVYDVFVQFNETYSGSGGIAQSVSSADLLALYRSIDDVNTAPGTAWMYNNGGWLILSAAIERITGQTLERVLWERIFEPVGMYDSLLRRSDNDFVSNSATQHSVSPTGRFERRYWGLDNCFGAGAVVSTVDDMLRWLAHMDTPKVGSAATWAAMLAPQILANGTSTGYGLGLMLDRYRGVETISHTGNALGGNAQMLKVPAAGLDIVILVNRQDVSSMQLANRIIDASLPSLDPVRESFHGPFATGTFRSPTTGRVIQLFGKNGRQIASVGGSDLAMEPDDLGVFWYVELWKDPKQSLTFIGDLGQPEAVRFSDFGNVDECVRVKPVVAPDVSAIAGHYRSDATGTVATIVLTEAGPRLTTAGRFGSAVFDLECVATDIWRTKPAGLAFLGGLLCFDRNATSFHFSNYQTRPLPFRRCP
jgi:D-aminopeptidase